jgi:peptidyl-prolyl cis-trans isomerase SurA
MSFRHKILSLAVMTLAAQALQAQGLRVPAAPAPAPATVSPTRSSTATTQADYIMAVVNSEPITSGDVREEMSRIALQLSQQGRPAPEAKAFASEVLESLINRKAQLQHAQDLGVRVEESVINQAEQNIALQNQFDVAELHRRVVRDGVSVKQFRATLADQITLQRLREREVESRVRVSDQEVEQYQSEQQSVVDVSKLQLNLAHILVAVPESATDVQVQALRVRAQRALDRAKAGEDFASLVREFSEASDVSNGGQLGPAPGQPLPGVVRSGSAGTGGWRRGGIGALCGRLSCAQGHREGGTGCPDGCCDAKSGTPHFAGARAKPERVRGPHETARLQKTGAVQTD